MTNDPKLGSNPTNSADTASKVGWRARCNPGKLINGNDSWEVHDDLVNYLIGVSEMQVSDPKLRILDLNASNRIAGQVNIGDLFSDYFTNRDASSVGYIPIPLNIRPSRSKLEAVMSSYSAIDRGDYIFGTLAQETGLRGLHGFMVVSKGPAVSCDSDYLNGGTLKETDLITKVPVFWVADVFGIQRGRARPFYCSALNDARSGNPPGEGFAGFFKAMARWEFYKVPTKISVPCERLYDPGINVFSDKCS